MSFFLLRFSRRKAAIYPMAFLFHVDQFYLVMRATPTSKARIYRLLLFAGCGLACLLCLSTTQQPTPNIICLQRGVGDRRVINHFSGVFFGMAGQQQSFSAGGGGRGGNHHIMERESSRHIFFSFLDREARRLRITKWRWIVMRILTLSDLSPPIFDTADRRL